MASWNGGPGKGSPNPPISPNLKQMQGPDNFHQESEENVTQQTEEVFRNFLYQSYRNEKMKQEFDATPSVTEFANFTQDPLSPASQVGRQLAKIGDDINERYANEFDQMINSLNIDHVSAYEAFAGVARKLFQNGINWGRILALFCLGYRIAMRVLRLGDRINEFASMLRNIIRNTVRFIADAASGIASWIARQGGWSDAMSYVPQMETKYWVFMFFAAVSAIAAVIYLRR
ncbi:hypothetical protein CHS0354_009269 [Potamilus streckersoni]|uniref:Bcl-2 Bcl-2 homology region 1-3 domain-containing protein n=1 Tax=Potamilus streckersoni TaxID=2493646 RepID=A0AAE0S378_9BIVA|nr:hypothetical protein CHS0354_009269 [Potamilus streckersoni]